MNVNKFTNSCRTCFSNSTEMQPLFKLNDISNSQLSFAFMVMKCASVQITENDGLPSYICDKCVELTVKSFQFRKQCENVDSQLRFYVSNSKRETETSLSDDNDIKNSEELFSEHVLEENPKEKSDIEIRSLENDFDDDVKSVYSADPVSVLSTFNEDHNSEMIEDNNCKICNRAFENSNSLELHQKVHNNKKLTCPVCFKIFSRAFDVQRHMTKHTGDKPFQCDYCGQSFTQSGTLVQHMRRHTDVPMKSRRQKLMSKEKTHLCNICGKSFKDASSLTIHIRRHTGEKPYECKVCNMRFVSSGRLTSHRRVHTGERPFICTICNKSFAHSTVIGLHMRTHTGDRPHQCNVCEKSFSTHYCLNIHTRQHTGERPHECVVCGKKFADPKVLKQHARIHSGERPHLCNVCGKGFRRTHHLKQHMKTHS